MSIAPQPASPTKDTAMLTARVDRELLAAFDAVAEGRGGRSALLRTVLQQSLKHVADAPRIAPRADSRSEEHTSELQSLMRISYAVFCLKKTNIKITIKQK